MRVHIRWMIRRDLREVLDIENACFDYQWVEEDFLRCLRKKQCNGLVVEHNDTIIGFMLYDLKPDCIDVLNFAVHPKYARRGIGKQMVGKLVGKLSKQQRTHLTLRVRESNLIAQIFFRAQGFIATGVERAFYADSHEDAYSMEYRLAVETENDDDLVNWRHDDGHKPDRKRT